jgi:ADP-ribosyl-[dinitrogen reductase] hydrolase
MPPLCANGRGVAPAFPLAARVEQLGSFASSPGKLRHFCRQCGSHLLAEREGSPYVILRVATLDDTPAQQASQHIWTSHDRPWLARTSAALAGMAR